MKAYVEGFSASLTSEQVAATFAEASGSSSSSSSSSAPGVALWNLYQDTMPRAAAGTIIEAAAEAAKNAALAAFHNFGGIFIADGEADADLAASCVGLFAREIALTFLREHKVSASQATERVLDLVMVRKLPVTAKLFYKWAKGQQIDEAGVEAVAAAAAEAAEQVRKNPWKWLSSSAWSQVVTSLHINLVKVKGEHRELLGGWAGDPGEELCMFLRGMLEGHAQVVSIPSG